MSEVKPNDVEMAQNLLRTLLMAILKDLEVFKWSWEYLMLEVDFSLSVSKRIVAHEMTLKLLQNGVTDLEIRLMCKTKSAYDKQNKSKPHGGRILAQWSQSWVGPTWVFQKAGEGSRSVPYFYFKLIGEYEVPLSV